MKDPVVRFKELASPVLFHVWDPIHVSSLGAPPDEYDSYIATIWNVLATSSDAEAVYNTEQILGFFQVDRMDVCPNKDRDQVTAKILAYLYSGITHEYKGIKK